MNAPSLSHLLDVATAAAKIAGQHTLQYFNPDTKVEFKADNTPVTRADREAELLVRDHLLAAFPTHSILGEEHGTIAGDPDYRWVIDPIDGTKSFVHGVPLYGTLIGLQVKGRPTVGVIYLPVSGDVLCAATGLGCFHNDAPAKVSAVDKIEQALILTSGLVPAIKRPQLMDLAEQCRISRTWGDAYGYFMVATGRAEIMADPKMSPWDCAAVIPVIQEAGGWCSAWNGDVTIDGGDLFACNDKLAEAVKGALAGGQ